MEALEGVYWPWPLVVAWQVVVHILGMTAVLCISN